jgi:hypothetical protein
LDMPDDPHGEISSNTRRMIDQQFVHPTHASAGEDFMGLENTLNNVLQQLGETVEPDLAEEVQALHDHKKLVKYDAILQAQTIEARRKACFAMALLYQTMPSQTLWTAAWKVHMGGLNTYKLWKLTKLIIVNRMCSYLTILQSQLFFMATEK